MSQLTSWLFKDKKNEAKGIIDDLSNLVDTTFTSDEERKVGQEKIERLYALNESTFVAGGRSAILWAIAIVFIYQAALRELIAMLMGIENLSESAFNMSDMLKLLIQFLSAAV